MKLVSTFALALAMTVTATTGATAQETPVDGVPGPQQDPYIWLEEARSPEALAWVAKENERTLAAFEADPRFATLKAEALAIFDSENRIPFVSFRPDGLYNFWQDKANPKGLLRRTTLESYRTDKPEWEIILDVDALAAAEGKEWVYQGSTCLPPALTKCMIALSDGGEDATILREFDTTTKQFVEGGFVLDAKSQGGVQWIDADTLLVGRNFGEGTLTESEYPFTSRVWTRGTAIADALEIFRGEPTDVRASASLLRDNAGTIHARTAFRGISFHESLYYVEKDGEWLALDIPKKASPYGIVDGHLLYSTDVDWTVDGQTFPADSLIAMDLEERKANPNGAKKTLVWAPGERQTKQGGAITGNALFVTLLDNVVGKVLQFNFEDGQWVSRQVALPDNATLVSRHRWTKQTRSCTRSAISSTRPRCITPMAAPIRRIEDLARLFHARGHGSRTARGDQQGRDQDPLFHRQAQGHGDGRQHRHADDRLRRFSDCAPARLSRQQGQAVDGARWCLCARQSARRGRVRTKLAPDRNPRKQAAHLG